MMSVIMYIYNLNTVLSTCHFISCLTLILKLQTFVAISESPFFASLNVGYPQVIIVDESYEVRFSRADLGIHTGP